MRERAGIRQELAPETGTLRFPRTRRPCTERARAGRSKRQAGSCVSV